MNFSLGIYDVFATAIPGALYLAATLYLTVRFGWVEWQDLAGLDTTMALTGALVSSYVLGQTLGPGMRWCVDGLPMPRSTTDDHRQEFRRRNPTLATRPFIQADEHTLLAGLRQVSPEAATEVDRARATGIMLRACSAAFILGSFVALAETGVQRHVAAPVAAVALAVLAALALRGGHKRSGQAVVHTFECATWIPDVDERLAPPPAD
ncbi:MAG: hypothetical protein ACRD2C_17480 [Acidimicrobiales bacterium]